MNLYWRRQAPGLYVSVGLRPGYEVGKLHSGEWYWETPDGVEGIADNKTAAQAACVDHENRKATA